MFRGGGEKFLRGLFRRMNQVRPFNITPHDHGELNVEILVEPFADEIAMEQAAQLSEGAFTWRHAEFARLDLHLSRAEHDGGDQHGQQDQARSPAEHGARRRRNPERLDRDFRRAGHNGGRRFGRKNHGVGGERNHGVGLDARVGNGDGEWRQPVRAHQVGNEAAAQLEGFDAFLDDRIGGKTLGDFEASKTVAQIGQCRLQMGRRRNPDVDDEIAVHLHGCGLGGEADVHFA